MFTSMITSDTGLWFLFLILPDSHINKALVSNENLGSVLALLFPFVFPGVFLNITRIILFEAGVNV